jgi:sporulation protein YlmC with PRC-barrel domain
MVNCVLISEEEGHITDVDINIKSDDLYRVLKGTGTFIGQFPDTEVVIMKCDVSHFTLIENRNHLPEPFDTQMIMGPILLILMDSEANPQDYTVAEYLTFLVRYPRFTV